MKKINLEEIIKQEFGQLSIDVMKGAYSRNEDPRNLLVRWQEVMKEAVKQALELAAENAEVALRIYSPHRRTLVLREENLGQEASTEHDFQYIVVDKDSILNTINQIE